MCVCFKQIIKIQHFKELLIDFFPFNKKITIEIQVFVVYQTILVSQLVGIYLVLTVIPNSG